MILSRRSEPTGEGKFLSLPISDENFDDSKSFKVESLLSDFEIFSSCTIAIQSFLTVRCDSFAFILSLLLTELYS